MLKFFKELRKVLFYGKPEGVIVEIYPYLNQNGRFIDQIMVVRLSKKVNFYDKKITRYADILMNANEIKNFKVGDYYCCEE